MRIEPHAAPALHRRAWLALAAAAGLSACALGHDTGSERIVDVAGARSLGLDEVVARMLASDFVLLGELHDNPHHHARRAALLERLKRPVAVVAEQLPRGAAPPLRSGMAGASLRAALEAAGFDARAWRWPLHEPLFTAVARGGHRLLGGNLDRDSARRLAREGASAMPVELGPLARHTLSDAARAALESDLREGHCGRLGPEHLPGMVWAQRGRDAAMAQAMLDASDARQATGARPVLLLAGNGHVRRDYGVPQLLAGQGAGARVLSIGFIEATASPFSARGQHDILWITPAAARDDPCKEMRTPAA